MKINLLAPAIFAATVALAALLAPVFAFAAPAGEEATVQAAVVSTSDLNLSSEEGMATLKARITGAVDRVCGTVNATVTLEQRRAISTCRTKAHNAAMAAVRPRSDQMLAQR